MDTHKNGALTAGLGVSAFAVFGLAGWVSFRLSVRERVNEEMEKGGLSRHFDRGAQIVSMLGMDLNLPPAVALAKSIVPMWSSTMPEEALIDIGRHGRQSKYWPADYRTPSSLAVLGVEDAAFAALLNEATTPRDGK